jgi:hypothetical protein
VEGGVYGGAGNNERIGGGAGCFATLSNAANSEVNNEAMTKIDILFGISMRGSVG